MWHATWKQDNWGDFGLLVVENQTPILAITYVLNVQMGDASHFRYLCSKNFLMT